MKRHNFHLPCASVLLNCAVCIVLLCCGLTFSIPLVEKPLNERVVHASRDFSPPLVALVWAPQPMAIWCRYYFSFQFPKTTWWWRCFAVANNDGKRAAQLFAPLLIFSQLMLIFTVCLHPTYTMTTHSCNALVGQATTLQSMFAAWQECPIPETRRSNNNSHSKSQNGRTHWESPRVSENCYAGFCFQFLPLIGGDCYKLNLGQLSNKAIVEPQICLRSYKVYQN